MSEDAVRLYVATVIGHEDRDEDTLIASMVRSGLDRAAAVRLATLVPLGFGRVILERLGVTAQPVYLVDGVEHVLADQPEFAAALEYATRASTEEMGAVIALSSEVDALNQALHAGAKPEDLVCGAPVLTEPLPPPPPARPVYGAQDRLDALLRAHDVATTAARFEIAVFPRSIGPELARLQLDLRVSSPALGDRTLVESFAGTGADVPAAVDEAMRKLATATLHPVLAALVDESLGADQVTWETWGPWRVCIGPLLLQFSTVEDLGFAGFLDHLRDRLLARSLSAGLHWVRVYHARRGGEPVVAEVLLDNDTCDDLQTDLAGRAWPASPDLYAFRCFLIMRR